MAHNPFNLEAFKNNMNGGNQPSGTEETAPVSHEETTPRENTAPATVPQTNAPAGGKKKTASSGKQSKNKKGELKTVSFYATLDEQYEIGDYARGKSRKGQRTTFTEVVRQAAVDSVRYTYECHDPNCGCRFTVRSKGEDTAPKPVRCPFCGGEKLRKV